MYPLVPSLSPGYNLSHLEILTMTKSSLPLLFVFEILVFYLVVKRINALGNEGLVSSSYVDI